MPSHRHHYLSQFYLRNFADPTLGKQVWRYKITGEPPVSRYPKSIAFEEHYHTVTLPDGTKDSDTLENMFGDLESEAAPVIQRILGGAGLTQDELQTFVAFAGAMKVRVPSGRDWAGKIVSDMAEQVMRISAHNKEGFHADVREREEEEGKLDGVDPEVLRQAFLRKDFELRTNPEVALSLSLLGMEAVVRCFLQMNWVFFRREGRFSFLTCDAPIICIDPTHPPGVWYGAGLLSPGMEVTFPLSPEVIAIGTHRNVPKGNHVAPPAMVKMLNEMRVNAARRFIVANENSDALVRFIQKNARDKPRTVVRTLVRC